MLRMEETINTNDHYQQMPYGRNIIGWKLNLILFESAGFNRNRGRFSSHLFISVSGMI